MNEQKLLKEWYHNYLELVEKLPKEMRKHGVFSLETEVNGHLFIFSHEGRIKVGNEEYPTSSVEKILGKCFDYSIIIDNLQKVAPNHMHELYNLAKQALESLEGFKFYKK